jgi:hypothetical protein
VGLSLAPTHAKLFGGEFSDVLRWSQTVIDLADCDPFKGNFIFGPPLALAFASRAAGRYWLGRPGWRDDMYTGLAMARSADPMSYVLVVSYVYFVGIAAGALAADDQAVREIEDAVQIAERSGDDFALIRSRSVMRWCTAQRLRSVTADRSFSRRSAKCSCAEKTCPRYR